MIVDCMLLLQDSDQYHFTIDCLNMITEHSKELFADDIMLRFFQVSDQPLKYDDTLGAFQQEDSEVIDPNKSDWFIVVFDRTRESSNRGVIDDYLDGVQTLINKRWESINKSVIAVGDADVSVLADYGSRCKKITEANSYKPDNMVQENSMYSKEVIVQAVMNVLSDVHKNVANLISNQTEVVVPVAATEEQPLNVTSAEDGMQDGQEEVGGGSAQAQTVGDNEKPLSPNEFYLKQMEEDEKRHELEMQKAVEEAKNKELYETYDMQPWKEGTVYLAKRKARWHQRRGVPCQDFCKAEQTDKCLVMVLADGVSSKELSHKGAEAACDVLIELIREKENLYSSEEERIEYFKSLEFRKSICDQWEFKLEKQGVAYKEAATTLVFVIGTENHFVAGTVGDGQIIFFEDEYYTVHKTVIKEDQATFALSGNRSYLDNFNIAVYDRDMYDHVLLSSDGMYDNFGDMDIYWAYAKEIRDRFSREGEPMQPFCFELNGTVKDYSSFGKDDDYSIVLFDGKPTEKNPLVEYALKKEPNVHMIGKIGDKLRLNYPEDEEHSMVIVVNTGEEQLPNLSYSRVVKAGEIHPEDGICRFIYQGVYSRFLNQCYDEGEFGEVSSDKSKFVLSVYVQLKRSLEQLWKKGFTLDDDADRLIFLDENDRVNILSVAIIPMEKEKGTIPEFMKMFDNIFAVICYGDVIRPLFIPGRLDKGRVVKWLGESRFDNNNMLRIIRKGDRLAVLNESDHILQKLGPVTELIKPGESFLLDDSSVVSYRRLIENEMGNIGVYSIIKKEEFL